MSTLQSLATKAIRIDRVRPIAGTYRTDYATLTAALAEIQPVDAYRAQAYAGATGKLFNCYIDPSYGVREHDRIYETATGKTYKVRTGGVSRRTMGSIDFDHVVMEEVA